MRWKRIIGWALAGLAALILVAVIGGYFYLKSSGFQHYTLGKIEEQVNLATGGRAEIRALDFDLSTLTAHLYHITVHGTECPNQPPLLQFDKLTDGAKTLSSLTRHVIVRDLWSE